MSDVPPITTARRDLTAGELLDATRLLIADPDRWMKGDYCDGAVGCGDSTKWSIEGALMEVANVDQVILFSNVTQAFTDVIVALGNMCGGKPLDMDARDLLNQALGRLATHNDLPETTHLDVINMLDEARIALLFKP